MKYALFLTLSFFYALASAQPLIELQVYLTGFSLPVSIAHAGDERLFIVQKGGTIRIIDGNGAALAQPFLNISARVNSAASERGLLGLAFHPDYANNGYFFVNYTNSAGNSRISRFSRSPANPNQGDPDSELILLEVNQPFSNHNGGCVLFGPDGYLYTSMGDGGSGGDPMNTGQTRSNLLGKMLRLDVDGGTPYAIPADNPFVSDNTTRNEIWALGLRNPWRFSFDRLTGDLWIADVGQNAWEEINFQPAGSPGGENYGWRCYEGFAAYNTNGCGDPAGYTQPVHVYPNNSSVGCSVTGGYVYRGSAFPFLYGKYIYADFCSGRFWSLESDGQGGWVNTELLDGANNQFVAFGEDAEGELYVAAISQGTIYRVRVNCAAQPRPEIAADVNDLSAPEGYAAYQWLLNGQPIDGAEASVYTIAETGVYAVRVVDGNGCTLVSLPLSIAVTSLETLGLQSLKLSPNPFADQFQLELASAEGGNYQIFLRNASGKLIFERRLEVGGQYSEIISTAGLPAGAYIFTIEKAGRRISRSLLKQ